MTKKEDCFFRGAFDTSVGPGDGQIDAAAAFVVDEQIVAEGHHIGLFEIYKHIAVGMAGAEMLHFYGVARKSECLSFSTMIVGRAPAGTGANVQFQSSMRVVSERCFSVFLCAMIVGPAACIHSFPSV
jgi:hypothetical protein